MSLHHPLRFAISVFVFSLGMWAFQPQMAWAVGFRPVSTDELKMTSEPLAPGAPAIILYRQVDRDDDIHRGHEDNYFRIKILSEEGRKYADIEIPYDKDSGSIIGIHARTIRPDGTLVDFGGKVFNKSIEKSKGTRYLAKTFTLPDVQVGSIIEYFYTIDLQENSLFNSNWILSQELFTKNAKFSLKPWQDPNGHYRMHWIWQFLPAGTPEPKMAGQEQVVRLEVSNIPAFQTEDYMPPENELKSRVDFIYSDELPESSPSRFWDNRGKKLSGSLDSFLGKRKAMEQAVAEIVGPNDPPEMKLEKIYARVQTLRNTSYEVRKTEQEEQREKEKRASSADEVWKRGYGTGWELTWLYLALVRAAGLEAYGVITSERANYFFNPNLMQSSRLDANVVHVKLNGKEFWCDPGAAYTPFGLLPWPETGTQGLELDKKGSTWVKTLTPVSSQARTERHADFKLSETGDLEGKLTVTFTGLEAARLRTDERNADETERRKFLEDTAKSYIPAACEVKLANQPDWKSATAPLAGVFDVKVPGWASGAGRRVLLPVGLFSAKQRHTFDHADRVHPIYVAYPFQEADDISIEIPSGWQVSSLPTPWNDTGRIVSYTLAAENNQGKLHVSRSLAVDFIFLEQKYYPALRNYFQEIRTADEQQMVLQPGAPAASR